MPSNKAFPYESRDKSQLLSECISRGLSTTGESLHLIKRLVEDDKTKYDNEKAEKVRDGMVFNQVTDPTGEMEIEQVKEDTKHESRCITSVCKADLDALEKESERIKRRIMKQTTAMKTKLDSVLEAEMGTLAIISMRISHREENARKAAATALARAKKDEEARNAVFTAAKDQGVDMPEYETSLSGSNIAKEEGSVAEPTVLTASDEEGNEMEALEKSKRPGLDTTKSAPKKPRLDQQPSATVAVEKKFTIEELKEPLEKCLKRFDRSFVKVESWGNNKSLEMLEAIAGWAEVYKPDAVRCDGRAYFVIFDFLLDENLRDPHNSSPRDSCFLLLGGFTKRKDGVFGQVDVVSSVYHGKSAGDCYTRTAFQLVDRDLQHGGL
ncbi:uncharacterized protein L3040_007461 [Drepanopeziza brunnea f. sp. 'multigermtubi']|uniref:Uncharacterized protein n=1 Tax=Marssonina brunnea f. sp. multigermtubi (strain MB_m1) TaxID=1072389 RepID=K1WLC2_MARBU|nr:uncharacterized protein MBM_03508 [Drepanopeziza brunnea f. sp. 'multigermtubi' MB_m1]EKD18515.1 hypothetical protein MBM_03508 [Drepanopeziza brunnea f. sp. 'multigermtubi' MB_m1]KAJ5037284.1 hypothetical protein L3040_007461 [Drepanopeziza brunnea f. sp. 'multigermtubi']